VTTETPMTVAELIAHLQSCDPNAVVMIDCEDWVYGGPVTTEKLGAGTARLIASFEAHTPKEDYKGNPAHGRPYTSPGGWILEPDYEDNQMQPAVERRPCVTIRAE
jgi:hypothetical protein